MPDKHKRARWAARRAAGLCGECGKVPSQKYARCNLCREMLNEVRRVWWKRTRRTRLNERKARYWSNPDRARAMARAQYHLQREKELARSRRYYLTHRAA